MNCLVLYSSSDSENEEKSNKSTKCKPKAKLPCAKAKLGVKSKHNVDSDEERYSNSALHNKRVRSFKHERGNWATYVFIPVHEHLLDDVPELCQTELADTVELNICDDFHITLSRTVVLQYHLIDNFTKSLEKVVKTDLSFTVFLGELEIYVNEEKTRTFIGYKVDSTQLINLLQKVDTVMEAFGLKRFYEVPSFHISFAWCLGDKLEILTSALEKLKQLTLQNINTKNISQPIDVRELRCKIGHKVYTFQLNKFL